MTETTMDTARTVPSLEHEYRDVVKLLAEMETRERIQYYPSLLERAPPMEADDLKEEHIHIKSQNNEEKSSDLLLPIMATISDDEACASLQRRNLCSFCISQIPSSLHTSSLLTTLNVSHNELMDLPGLATLKHLTTLNIERNWFNTLPVEIGQLPQLTTLVASRNFFRPNASSLQLDQLKKLTKLRTLNLLYNQKCGREHHRAYLQTELGPKVAIQTTIWTEVGDVPGTYVGLCAAERNANLLRSQLEPLGTVTLRKRLVQDFGQVPIDPAQVDRAGVMERLLECYRREGLVEAESSGLAVRKQVHLDGVPVEADMLLALLVELRKWTEGTGRCNKNRERPSIQADNYMILRSPKFEEGITAAQDQGETMSTRASRRAIRKAKKLEHYRKIWDLAHEALTEVDPIFAERCTEIAVTYKFQGSPHRDKQNCGPFYGLAMGDFPDGQGGICVECSARVVAVMNTKDRLGRVDGRYPHWVAPYDEMTERYSLIYYETGDAFVKPGPAVFSVPIIRT